MIVAPRAPRRGSAADRLLQALEPRGHKLQVASPGASLGGDVFLCPAPEDAALDLRAWLGAHPPGANTRLLVVTRMGTHPDAKRAALLGSWALEEAARGSGLPTLTLRIGPLLGPESPLWLRLRARPGLPRDGVQLLNPVAEADVVETLDRALSGRAAWEGWYEAAGPEVWSLAELAALARECGPPLPDGAGAWEPPLEEMEEHRLAEAGPWLGHFGLSVRPLAEQARAWSAAPAGSAA